MKRFLKNIAYELGGSAAFAVGIGYFVNSSSIAPGGVSGVSLMLNYLYGFPLGLTSLLLNVPILVWGWFYLNKQIIIRSLRIIFTGSVFLDIAATYLPLYTGDRLLGAVFGGVLAGLGIGIIFLRGGSTGGTDILSYIIQKKYPFIQIGTGILIIDCIIIFVSILVFNDIESGLFGLISLFCTTRVIDTVVYGTDSGSVILIISDKTSEISEYITNNLERGVTIWDGIGGYSGRRHSVLMCAVRTRQFAALKNAVKKIDKRAFMINIKSNEIHGEGFGH